MDVEIVAGLCAGARISVFFAPFDQKGWIDLLDRVVAAEPAAGDAVCQLGAGRRLAGLVGGRARCDQPPPAAASSRGITVCAATGDDGSGDQMHDAARTCALPGVEPVCAGGRRHDARRREEVVWWNAPGDRSQPRGGSTGGGVSVKFPRPEWQDVHVSRRSTPARIDGTGRPRRRGARGTTRLQPRVRRSADAQRRHERRGAAMGGADRANRRGRAAGAQQAARFLTPLLYRSGHDGRARGATAFHRHHQGPQRLASAGRSATTRSTGTTRSAAGASRTGRRCSPRWVSERQLRAAIGRPASRLSARASAGYAPSSFRTRDRLLEQRPGLVGALIVDQHGRRGRSGPPRASTGSQRARALRSRGRAAPPPSRGPRAAAASRPAPRARCARRNGGTWPGGRSATSASRLGRPRPSRPRRERGLDRDGKPIRLA